MNTYEGLASVDSKEVALAGRKGFGFAKIGSRTSAASYERIL
jgi:hypothetical protein